MERILIGVDDEAASQVAVDWVIDRAKERACDILLVTACDTLMNDPQDDQERLDRTRLRILHELPGASVSTSVVDGSEVETLVEGSRVADLLVIGNHRNQPMRSLLTGAMPARLAARSHCATVVVPDDWARQKGAVVLGIGGDDSSTRAADFAAREAMQPRRPLVIVHGWRLEAPVFAELDAFVAGAGQVAEEHAGVLREASDRVLAAFPTLEVSAELVEDLPSAAVLGQASRAELIVVGTHRRGAMSGLLLGSTAQELFRVSRVPVCVVPLVAPLSPVGGAVAEWSAA